MCRVLEVSVSGFYAWKQRPLCARKREDGELSTRIQEVFEHHHHHYGSPRIHAELRGQGIRCGRKRVVRLMQILKLSARRRKKRMVTTISDPDASFAPNLLQRAFEAEAPNTKWVTDITFIETLEGWLFLAAVLDLFSRAIVGWAMADKQDEVLVEQALRMALVRRHPQDGLLHHSDRGCQYTSDAYQQFLSSWGIEVSMSRKGNCWDNAVMERFFGTLKGECTDHYVFATRRQARGVVFEYIECYYNRERRHSALGYVSPTEFEALKS